MPNRLITIILCLLTALPSMGKGHHIRAMRGVVAGGYNFWFAVPQDYKQVEKPLPLIVFLHGASLCGRDMNRAKRYGTINAIEKGLDIEAIVVAPQNPGGAWNPQRIARVMDYVEQHYNVDRNREYALGMSLGSFGTLDLVGTYPERFAAAMAICGGTQLKSYEGLASLPLWIIHGTADRAVPVSRSREIVNTIRKNFDDDLLVYSELKGVNHSKPCRLFYHIDTYYWLLRHHLKHRLVDRSYKITAATVNKPYDLSRDSQPTFPFEGEYDASLPSRNGHGSQAEPAAASKAVAEAKSANGGTEEAVRGDKPSAEYHKIRSGDTLTSIARRYHTSVKALCKLNNIGVNSTLSVGRRIRVR